MKKHTKDVVNFCEYCGEKFISLLWQKHRFCSRTCYWSWLKGRSREKILSEETLVRVKDSLRKKRLNKTYEEIFGPERALEIRTKIQHKTTIFCPVCKKIKTISINSVKKYNKITFCRKECKNFWVYKKRIERKLLIKKEYGINRQLNLIFKYDPNNPHSLKLRKRKTKLKNVTLICKFCNEPFIRKINNSYTPKFCSSKCYGKYIKKLGGVDNCLTPELSIKTKQKRFQSVAFSGNIFTHTREGPKHKKIKLNIGKFLESKKYEVYYEVFVWVGGYFRIADVVGFKGNEKVVVECGETSKRKLKEYEKIFQYIIHIPYRGKIKYLRGLPF